MVHVIKAYYDSGNGIPEIRRVAVWSDVLTKFVLLEQKIVELYPVLKDKSFRIAWKDSDGDLIQMSSDPELAQALANAEDGLMKLYITLQPCEIPSIPVSEAAEFNNAAETSEANTAKANEEVHPFVICDGCNNSVKGYRYKCLECKDFDLCSSCHAANKHPEHDMLKLTRPHSVSREWVFPGARHMWRGMFGHCPKRFHSFHNIKENSAKKDDQHQKSADSNSDNKSEEHQKPTDFFDIFGTLLGENPGNAIAKMAELCQKQLLVLSKVADVDVNVKCAFKKPEDNEQAAKEAGKNEDDTEKNKPKVENGDASLESNKIKHENKCEDDGSKIPQSDILIESQLEPELNKSDQEVQESATSGDNSANEVRPKVITLGFSSDFIEKNGNEHLSGSAFKPPAGGLFAPESGNCDDWTLLNKDDADKNAKPCSESADDSCVKQKKQEVKQDGGFDVLSQDPKIASALMKMKAMGFTNEGGWLERLLVTKEGNINDALDALYPNTQRH